MTTSMPSIAELAQGWAQKDPPPAYVFTAAALLRAYRIVVTRQEAALVDLDLSISRFAVLSALERSEERALSLSALSRLTFIPQTTLTYTVDHLEQRGLIARKQAANDRRSVIAALTPAGRSLTKEAFRRLTNLTFGLSDLAPDEAAEVARLLGKIEPNPSDEVAPETS